jgi:hypothetical protein
MLGSTVLMAFLVWFGERFRMISGVLMLLAYIAFLVLEFALIHKV